MARSATRPIPFRWWLRPVSRQARVGEHSAVVRKLARRTPPCGQGVDGRGVDVRAVAAELGEAHVVEDHQDDVRARPRGAWAPRATRAPSPASHARSDPAPALRLPPPHLRLLVDRASMPPAHEGPRTADRAAGGRRALRWFPARPTSWGATTVGVVQRRDGGGWPRPTRKTAAPGSRRTTARSGRSPRPWPHRSRPRTRRSSRCPTSAPPSGTSATPPGSSRPSSSSPSCRATEPCHPAYGYVFNSYYEAVGARHPRPERGLLSRPGAAEVLDYRRHVDRSMGELLGRATSAPETLDLVELGLHHEQQHQELLLMDIKHVLSCNPLRPAYAPLTAGAGTGPAPAKAGWIEHQGGPGRDRPPRRRVRLRQRVPPAHRARLRPSPWPTGR